MSEEKGKSKYDKIKDKAKKRKKKTVKVLLPATSIGEEPTEHEIEYKDKLLIVEVEKLAAKGFTNDQIIEKIGISRDTFYRRLKNEPYFSYALFKHRNIATLDVENALMKRCLGYTVLEKTTEAKPIKEKDQHGNETTRYVMTEAKVTEKTIEPDPKSIEFYLTNRAKKEWSKRPEPEMPLLADMSNITFSIKRRSE